MTYKIFWCPGTVAEMILGGGLVTAKMISEGGKSMFWKNDFKGWAFQTTPESPQKLFQGGGEVQPPEPRVDLLALYIVPV